MDPAMKRQLRMFLSDPVELGVHVHGPKLLARSEGAALGLRAVYGNTWGLDIELKLARATEPPLRPFPKGEDGQPMAGFAVFPPPPEDRPPQFVPGDPMEGFRFGMGWTSGKIRLDTLPTNPCGDPQAAWPWWYLSHMGGSGHLGMDVAVRVSPYPPDGVIWVGWSWPQLGLATGEAMITLPPLSAITADAVTLRSKPDESQCPPEVRDHLSRIRGNGR